VGTYLLIGAHPIAVPGKLAEPRLTLAWLFFRTGTLLAPILFHGLANVSYALMGMALMPS